MQIEKDAVTALQAEIEYLKTEHKLAIARLEENVRLEELYKESLERFRTVFEYSKLGNKIISSDLKIIQVNPALTKLMGYSEEELVGSRILDYAHPEYKNDWFVLQKQLWAKQTPSFSLETCLIRKDGSQLPCNVNSILFPDGGQTLGFTTIEDISARKNTEASLHKNEEMLRFIMEYVPQKIFTASPAGEVTYYNQQWEVFTGFPLKEIENWGWTQFIHPEDVESTIQTWQSSVKESKNYEIQHRFRAKDGSYCWHLTRAVPIKEKNGCTVLWVGSSTNLDSHKRAEERKDEFISIASHELKTPLTNIKAYNQLLLKKMQENSSTYRFLKKSSEAIDRLHHLISDLLDVTKINAGKVSYNFEEFDFKDILNDSVESIQHTSPTHKIIVERVPDVKYTGDRIRIEQVLNNFLSNAIKYSPTSDRVIVNSYVEEESIIVSIQDFGIGIAPENLDKLFNRYYRVDNTSSVYQGLGLGLYIAAEILKRHNGTFWIESELGKGSTFYFRLPLKTDEDDQGRLTLTAYRDNHLEIKYNKGKQILYADWKGFQTFETVQKGCMLMLDLLSKNKCCKVLNDNTNVKGTWSEAADWVSEQWFPMMEEAGLTHFAWIYSPAKFSQLSANKSADVKSTSVQIRFFHIPIHAELWLTNVKTSRSS